jgi:DNA ligase-1
METVYETGILKARLAGEGFKYWRGHIGKETDTYYTFSSFWMDTKEGISVVRYGKPYEVKEVNTGKRNQRGGYEQALRMITFDFETKKAGGYTEDGEAEKLRPMLAHKYAEGKYAFPMLAQPKIDGMRALWINGKFTSRLGHEILPEVTEHIKPLQGMILDGELCLPHESYGFQDTMRACKKKCELSSRLLYYVFDTVDVSKTAEERIKELVEKYKEFYSVSASGETADIPELGIRLVITQVIQSHEEMLARHYFYVSLGYEGIILRKPKGKYERGKRSSNLLKYKSFTDSEFKVIGVREGEGNEKGMALFQCVTPEGLKFDCRPKGTQEYRKEIWSNSKSYIGKWLTVKYQELSELGIPRFPVGVGIREDA